MQTFTKKLSFTEWKSKFVKEDSLAAGVDIKFRDRYWYYQEYGKYCKKFLE